MSSTPPTPTAPSIPATTSASSALVIRSNAPPGLPYQDYKPYLRYDYFYSCAYCTMMESEAQSIRFTIDHYEPRAVHPELTDDYLNLQYSCEECNGRKGDRCPPPNARAAGFRFFRPDTDDINVHFQIKGKQIEGKTGIGEYTTEAIDLNRKSLKKIRELRNRLHECHKFVLEGIAALRRMELYKLPQNIQREAIWKVRQIAGLSQRIEGEIDEVLSRFAASPLVGLEDDEEEADRREARKAYLDGLKAMYPGQWNSPKRKK